MIVSGQSVNLGMYQPTPPPITTAHYAMQSHELANGRRARPLRRQGTSFFAAHELKLMYGYAVCSQHQLE